MAQKTPATEKKTARKKAPLAESKNEAPSPKEAQAPEAKKEGESPQLVISYPRLAARNSPPSPKPAAAEPAIPKPQTAGPAAQKTETPRPAPPKSASPQAPKPAPQPAPKAGLQREAPKPAQPIEKSAPAVVPSEQKKPEADEFTDLIGGPIESWWNFIQANYAEYYLRLLKLNLVRVLLQFAFIAILAAIGIGLLMAGSSIQVPGGPLVAIAVLAVLVLMALLLLMWFVQSFENAAYILTDAQLGKKPYYMADALGTVAGKTLGFVILDSLLRIVILLPAILIFAILFAVLLSGSPAATVIFIMGIWLAVIVLTLYRIVTDLIYHFLTQFWRYGFLLQGKGVIDSLKGGIAILKSHPFEVLVFDFIVVVMSFVASIPLMLFSAFMYFIFLFAQFALFLIPPFGLVIYFLLAFFVALVAVFLSSLVEMVWRPMHMAFWKKVAGLAGK